MAEYDDLEIFGAARPNGECRLRDEQPVEETEHPPILCSHSPDGHDRVFGTHTFVKSLAAEIDRVVTSEQLTTAFGCRLGHEIPTEGYVSIVANREADVAELLAVPAARAVGAVVTGVHRDAGCQITIADDGSARIEPLGITFTAIGLQAGTEEIIGDTPDELLDLLDPELTR